MGHDLFDEQLQRLPIYRRPNGNVKTLDPGVQVLAYPIDRLLYGSSKTALGIHFRRPIPEVEPQIDAALDLGGITAEISAKTFFFTSIFSTTASMTASRF